MKQVLQCVIRILLSVLVIATISELSLRIFGFKAAEKSNITLKAIFPTPFVSANSLTGFSLNPGRYIYLFENGFSFIASHDSSGFRKTSYKKPKKLPAINFYGCSFFYGYGLPDSSVFCWKLNKNINDFQINNCSIYGHGMVTPLLLLNQQIKNNIKPKIAVISYASFNLSRDVYSLNFLKSFKNQQKMTSSVQLKYPYVRLKKKLELELKYSEFKGAGFPLTTVSVLANKLEETYINFENKMYKPKLIDSLLIEKYISLCKKNNIELVFAFITRDDYTTSVYNWLTAKQVHCADLFVDYTDPKFNLMPYDNHPDALAHALYATKMEDYLRKIQLIH